MNGLAFESPWALAALVFVLLPWWRSGIRRSPYPWLGLLAADPLSFWLDMLVRLIASLAFAALSLALAGPYLAQREIERVGHGAHIVVLLDRSRSMDTTFAGKTPAGGEQSKSAAARRLLTEFIDRRPHDLIGLAAYSTAPLFVMPLTDNKQALHAAVDATAAPALAYTNISKGLGMALSFFDDRAPSGSRIVLLVSDGAAAIDADSEAALIKSFLQQQVRLYWLFLRAENNPGIFHAPADPADDTPDAMPELYLHRFFTSLHIPYQAYEADNPAAMQAAMAEIDRQERLPLHYRQIVPQQDLSGLFYAGLTLALALLLGFKWCEVTIE